jgi:hypothetical protein
MKKGLWLDHITQFESDIGPLIGFQVLPEGLFSGAVFLG